MQFSNEESNQEMNFHAFNYSEELYKRTGDGQKLEYVHKLENPLH